MSLKDRYFRLLDDNEKVKDVLFLCMSELFSIYCTEYGGVENAIESSNALCKGMEILGDRFKEVFDIKEKESKDRGH